MVASGRIAVRMMGAVVVLLGIAGTIEGFLSVSGRGLAPRIGTSAGSLAFLVAYLARGAAWRRTSALSQHGPHPDRQSLDLA